MDNFPDEALLAFINSSFYNNKPNLKKKKKMRMLMDHFPPRFSYFLISFLFLFLYFF
jgi:hypothetical protein